MSDLLLVCTYLPCKSSNPNWRDQFLNTLYALEEDISTINYKDIIIAGDWNVDFNTNHPIKEILLSFLKSNDLCVLDKFHHDSNSYTFRVESSGAESLIDHFVVSKRLVNIVSNVNIIDDAFNHSDHCPVTCQLQFDLSTVTSTNRSSDVLVNELRWDKSNLSEYVSSSEFFLKIIIIPWFLFDTNQNVWRH